MTQTIRCLECGEMIETHWQLFEHVHQEVRRPVREWVRLRRAQ